MMSTTFMTKPCFQFGDKESALIYDVFIGDNLSQRSKRRGLIQLIRGHFKWPQRQLSKLHPVVRG